MLDLKEVILTSFSIILPMLFTIAFFTLAERKIMASLQRRQGPNVVGLWGLLQPIVDGLKLVFKEIIIPAKANFFLFLTAPMILLTISFALISLIPFSYSTVLVHSQFSLLLLFTLSSFNVYCSIIAGWSSNSKYALLGTIRSIAQMLSYELVIGTILLIVLLCTGSLDLMFIVYYQQYSGWLFFPLFPVAIIFFISILAETNRAPFDLPEAESELVAGYNVEYSSITFSLFFLGEYSNILAMTSVYVLVFLGGWLPPISFLKSISPFYIFTIKVLILCCFFIFIRAALPRYRFDQLMFMGWSMFLPFSFGYFIFLLGIMTYTHSLPVTCSYFNMS